MTNGSCLCGKVTFTIGGTLSNMTHCHCSICRKIHGSLFATYLNATELSITGGQDFIQTYNSSQGFHRCFCKQCGSVLPEKANAKEDSFYIPAGLLDDDPGIRPEAHIFSESKSDTYTIHDALPQLTHYGDGDTSLVVETPTPALRANKVSGGCQCGDVAFEYSGAPKFMMHCHCSRCRKVKGAAHATNAFVPVEQFDWLHGQDKIVNYDLPEAERFGNAFCGNCGSSVPRESVKTGMFNIPVGSLDCAPGVEARGHIYIGSSAPWFEVNDQLSQWDEMPS